MLKKLYLLFFILTSLNVSSQSINGKVYDAETTVKGALVVNISQNIMTYTDDEGHFKIHAKVRDTLYVSSLFHTKKLREIKSEDFNHIVVIEVKKTINKLDEVLLRDEREKKFDSTAMENQVKNQIKEDIKRNPGKYGAVPKYGLDLVAIGKFIGKLFKRKNKTEAIQPLTYKSVDSLFKNNSFFNKTLLIVDLNIPEDYHSLFFEYLETKQIDSKLLKNLQAVDLLEEIVLSSQEFHKILEEVKNEP